jgi:hypothetical protein
MWTVPPGGGRDACRRTARTEDRQILSGDRPQPIGMASYTTRCLAEVTGLPSMSGRGECSAAGRPGGVRVRALGPGVGARP